MAASKGVKEACIDCLPFMSGGRRPVLKRVVPNQRDRYTERRREGGREGGRQREERAREEGKEGGRVGGIEPKLFGSSKRERE